MIFDVLPALKLQQAEWSGCICYQLQGERLKVKGPRIMQRAKGGREGGSISPVDISLAESRH